MFQLYTFPETNTSENEWLEDDPFLLGFSLFSGAFAVSFREGNGFCGGSAPGGLGLDKSGYPFHNNPFS